MYCLIDFCCVCFDNKEHLQPLSGFGSDDITYINKLTSCIPVTCFNQMNNKSLICNKCCETMDAAYKFRHRCLRSNTTLTDYISHLHQIGNISGVIDVYLTDLNKFIDIQKENNTEKTEMFINVNENTIDKNFVINPTTEIKMENNPTNLKLIGYGNNYIPFENVIIKMEQENQNSDEDIEESFDNILVNRPDTKIDVSQNDIKLTASAINRGNENQDFEKHLHERLDNNLEIFDSKNDDMAAKVEENNYNSLHSEECFDDPSANLEEKKIDIVDNDIKPMNSEINIQCKSENNEEFSTEDEDLSLEDEDTTDKEKKFFHKIHTEEKLHECDICQLKFTQLARLMLHKRIHTGEKPYICEVCQKKFRYLSSLRNHMKLHTREKAYECDVCQKKFHQSDSLIRHMRIHTGEKPYECDICQKKFSCSSNLSVHMKIHTEEKSYECDVCHKKFAQGSNLGRHMRVHTGETPYACDICQKKFGYSSSLRNHMIIHTGEKTHECDVCQKKFNRSSNLSKHMIIHTGEKRYECDVCQKKFNHPTTLSRHIKIHTRETR